MNLLNHYKKYGVSTRVHGNTKRVPKNTHSFEDLKDVVTFITNYAEVNAQVLPGRIPGCSRTDVKLLPSADSKSAIWQRCA